MKFLNKSFVIFLTIILLSGCSLNEKKYYERMTDFGISYYANKGETRIVVDENNIRYEIVWYDLHEYSFLVEKVKQFETQLSREEFNEYIKELTGWTYYEEFELKDFYGIYYYYFEQQIEMYYMYDTVNNQIILFTFNQFNIADRAPKDIINSLKVIK